MTVVERAALFVVGCLVIGLGLFWCTWSYHAARAAQELYRSRRMPAAPARLSLVSVLGGVLLMGVGAYVAWLAVPL